MGENYRGVVEVARHLAARSEVFLLLLNKHQWCKPQSQRGTCTNQTHSPPTSLVWPILCLSVCFKSQISRKKKKKKNVVYMFLVPALRHHTYVGISSEPQPQVLRGVQPSLKDVAETLTSLLKLDLLRELVLLSKLHKLGKI